MEVEVIALIVYLIGGIAAGIIAWMDYMNTKTVIGVGISWPLLAGYAACYQVHSRIS